MTPKDNEHTTATFLARLDERLKVVEETLKQLKTTITTDIDSLRDEIRAGFGAMKDKYDDHEKRILLLEETERQRREQTLWVRPVVTGVVIAAVVALLGALAYVLANYAPLFKP